MTIQKARKCIALAGLSRSTADWESALLLVQLLFNSLGGSTGSQSSPESKWTWAQQYWTDLASVSAHTTGERESPASTGR